MTVLAKQPRLSPAGDRLRAQLDLNFLIQPIPQIINTRIIRVISEWILHHAIVYSLNPNLKWQTIADPGGA